MNIIVTGASQGIGYELVLALSKIIRGKIMAVARTKNKLLQLKQKAECDNPAIQIIPFSADLTNQEIDDELIDVVAGEMPALDILINNAGTLINKSFMKMNNQDIRNIFETNFFSQYRLIQHTMPYLERSKSAHIVNIGSMGGFQGSKKFPGLSAYSASKAALACFTECLAEELKDKNIKVNCLALGAIQTNMLSDAFPEYTAPMTPPEIADFIAHFSIHGSKFFNGKILPVSDATP